ncbi:MAG: hypothetical protein QOI38_806 [Sphingomonadales bacterium]|jgi:succinate dehydrogenase/fumarate reductase flavoprotein subunit|nr:hypothetical protein [Sphingomonadales bacterium]
MSSSADKIVDHAHDVVAVGAGGPGLRATMAAEMGLGRSPHRHAPARRPGAAARASRGLAPACSFGA